MIVYLDTSVVLRIFLRQPDTLEGWETWDGAFSSEILPLEVARAFDRIRLLGMVDADDLASRRTELDGFLSRLEILALDTGVLRRAAMPLSNVVGTLDAIHLASALIVEDQFGERPVFATHDRQQGLAAQALGFQLLGV